MNYSSTGNFSDPKIKKIKSNILEKENTLKQIWKKKSPQMKTTLIISSMLVQILCLTSSVQLKTVLKSKLLLCKRQII